MAAGFLERMGARMRERRESLGLSRAEIARRMPGKVNENQVYRWELGKHQPNPDTLEALAKVLECEVADFMAPMAEKAETPELIPDAGQLDRIEQKLDGLPDAGQLDRIEQKLDGLAARLDESVSLEDRVRDLQRELLVREREASQRTATDDQQEPRPRRARRR